ncbi:MAG TPA: hypothetical protein V6C97_02225 [Oculatellaceae cyanobacterium]
MSKWKSPQLLRGAVQFLLSEVWPHFLLSCTKIAPNSIDKRLASGKFWIEREALAIFADHQEQPMTISWSTADKQFSQIYYLTVSGESGSERLAIPLRVITMVNSDKYVQSRLRHKLKRMLHFLIV